MLDLGQRPLADGLVASKSAALSADQFPLRLVLCTHCGLVQLREAPPPDRLFGDDFPYFSSINPDLVTHASKLVDAVFKRRSLGPDSLVLELASNDGYLLRHVAERGVPVLGIDPASGPAACARQQGIETRHAFFDRALAADLQAEGLTADVVIANNVLAHVPDPLDFLTGVADVLKTEGLAVFEVAWGGSLIQSTAFDQIYHEHHCYFTVGALVQLLERAGLVLLDVEKLTIHSGSLRAFVAHSGQRSARVDQLIAQEQQLQLHRPEPWRQLHRTLATLRGQLYEFLDDQHRQGLRLAAYGAAAKGTMLLNWLQPNPALLAWVADISPHKHGLFVPGLGLPVVATERIDQDCPDRMLLLPWNWAAEIARDQSTWIEAGGRFILPLPEPRFFP